MREQAAKGLESEDKQLLLYVIELGEPMARRMTWSKGQVRIMIFAAALWMAPVIPVPFLSLLPFGDRFPALVLCWGLCSCPNAWCTCS